MRRAARNLLASVIFATLGPNLTFAAGSQGDTVVTTYITHKQEERDSTRFTLTEWLRIKERMKMLDLWLAMFTDPKKDHFSLELSGGYLAQNGSVTNSRAGVTEEGTLVSRKAGGQIYLTNILTWATKLRTLNVDLGAEGFIKQSDALKVNGNGNSVLRDRKESLKYFMGNLRIFGKHVQDSSLVLKYGQYQLASSLASSSATDPDFNVTGQAAGVELQLYVFRWLGFEGSAYKFGAAQSAFNDDSTHGMTFEYGPYIEIALLRLVGGAYRESWRYGDKGSDLTTSESGYYGGVKLML